MYFCIRDISLCLILSFDAFFFVFMSMTNLKCCGDALVQQKDVLSNAQNNRNNCTASTH